MNLNSKKKAANKFEVRKWEFKFKKGKDSFFFFFFWAKKSNYHFYFKCNEGWKFLLRLRDASNAGYAGHAYHWKLITTTEMIRKILR